jgi:hypothetical protein
MLNQFTLSIIQQAPGNKRHPCPAIAAWIVKCRSLNDFPIEIVRLPISTGSLAAGMGCTLHAGQLNVVQILSSKIPYFAN